MVTILTNNIHVYIHIRTYIHTHTEKGREEKRQRKAWHKKTHIWTLCHSGQFHFPLYAFLYFADSKATCWESWHSTKGPWGKRCLKVTNAVACEVDLDIEMLSRKGVGAQHQDCWEGGGRGCGERTRGGMCLCSALEYYTTSKRKWGGHKTRRTLAFYITREFFKNTFFWYI